MLKNISDNKNIRIFIIAISIILIGAGFAVLSGWILNISTLKSILPNFVSMKANTAIAFVLLGIALLFQKNKYQTISLITAFLVALIGCLTIIQYVFGTNLGIDQLLFSDMGAILTSNPGRMAIVTAINFSFLGIGFILLVDKYKKTADILALFVLLVSELSFIGYLFNVQQFYNIGGVQITAMALHTSILFILISLGLLASNIENGFFNFLISPSYGTRLFRRTIIPIVILTSVIGWVIHIFSPYRYNFYNYDFAIAIELMSTVTISVFILSVSANIIEKENEYKRNAELEVIKLKKEKEEQLKNNYQQLKMKNEELEKNNKVMVDRELRMIELKKEIDDLKKKCS